MLGNSDSRFYVYCSLVLCSFLLAALGCWAMTGVLSYAAVSCAVVINGFSVLISPFIPYRGDDRFVQLLALNAAVSVVFGILIFGFWGLGYLVGAIAAYLLVAAIANNR